MDADDRCPSVTGKEMRMVSVVAPDLMTCPEVWWSVETENKSSENMDTGYCKGIEQLLQGEGEGGKCTLDTKLWLLTALMYSYKNTKGLLNIQYQTKCPVFGSLL